MTSQLNSDETRKKLDNLLRQWNTRWRLRQVILYLPRIIIVMCGIAVLLALVIALFNLLSALHMLIVSALAMGTSFILMIGAIAFWRKDTQESARQFDALFGSQERFSTAFELLDGRIQTGQEIAERQLQDSYQFAKDIDTRKRIPLKVNWLEWIAAGVVVLITIACLFFSAYVLTQQANAISEATQIATDDAAELTRDITGEIATDTDLTEDERSSLLESAETALSELENPETSAEDAFLAMSDLESDLREQAESIEDSASASSAAMASAMEALTGEQQSSENPGDALSDELSELADQLDDMSEEEQDALAEALQEAMDALGEGNEALAEALQEALSAMQNNQAQDAQDAMNQASEQAQSSEQQNQSRSETAESLEESANEAQEAAQEIAESESQDSQSQQEGEAQEGEEGNQETEPGTDAQNSVQSQEVQQSQSGEDGDPGQDGDPGEQGQQQEAENGQPSEQQEGESSDSSEQGSSSGDSSSDNSSLEISGEDTGEMQADTVGDGGESDYEPIFAPPLGDIPPSDTDVELETDDSSSTTIEGDFQENPDGESNVPYNQVFETYADAANSALENGYVPLGVRDVVRDYFTSIEPTGNNE